jgi:hypothetical protein
MANPFDEFDEPQANPFDEFDEAPKGASLPKGLQGAGTGALEAAGSMVSGIPSQIAGGLAGLSTGVAEALRTGSLEKGVNKGAATSEYVQDKNFGFGKYEPSTKKGKEYSENLGKAFAYPGEKAGDVGGYIGKQLGNENLGRLSLQLPVDAAMNFLDPALGIGALRGAARLTTRGGKKPSVREKLDAMTPEPKAPNPFDEFDAPAQGDMFPDNAGPGMHLTPEQIAELRARQSGQRDMFNEANMYDQSVQDRFQQGQFDQRTGSAQASIDARQAAMEEQVRRQATLDMNAAERARQEAAPVPGLEDARAREIQDSINRTQDLNKRGQQMGIVEDFGNNDPMSRMPNMRIDENGIPIRADLSMEAANLENPLQRNLWGDELPRKHEQEAPYGITQAIDRMPDTPWRGSRDEGIDMLSNGPIKGGRYGSQRGAVNMDIFDSSYEREKRLPNGIVLKFKGDETMPEVKAYKEGVEVGKLQLNTKNYMNPSAKENLRAGWVDTHGAPKQGIAPAMYKFAAELGNDIVPSNVQTVHGKAMWERFKADGTAMWNMRQGVVIPKGQRGSIDPDLLSLGLATRLRNTIDQMRGPSPLTAKEQILKNSVGDLIFKGEAPEKIIADAMKEQDGPALWTNVQSGLPLAADKANSSLMRGISRWLSYAEKTTKLQVEQKVKPVEKALGGLNKDDITGVMDVMRAEMFNKQTYSPEQLRAAGLNTKQLDAYSKLRQAFNDVLDTQNAARAKLGKKPITPENAYLASMWDGNWHLPIKDANGKLVWYIKAEKKGEVLQAVKWLKENHPELSTDLKPTYHPENISTRLPRDVMGAYQDMLSFFDGEDAAMIRDSFQNYTAERAYKWRQHDVHFENKANVRGFLGDRPWLSPEQNAYAQAKAQVRYLKDAYEWAPKQEALANIKEVMSSPELNATQPNNMEMSKAYVGQAMGLSRNMFRAPEQAIAKALSTSPAVLGKYVSTLKTFTYLQQLGLSGGYMIATPLQSFLLGPALHWKLSNEGMPHNALVTMAKAMNDFTLGISGEPGPGMTKVGREALAYAKENGIISSNLFDEYADIGEHRVTTALKNSVGLTISAPERIARLATFMSFVHHLDASGLKGKELYLKAEDYTNHTLTNFHRSARPLVVDRLGQMGELAYTYKSPIFNMFNNLSMFARDGLKTGRWGPLSSALAMTALMAGPMNLPGANELADALDIFKGMVAKGAPQLYPHVEKIEPREAWIGKMAELSASDNSLEATVGRIGQGGIVSAATGAQMASRFSAQTGDVSNPLGNIAPAATELRELASIGKVGLHRNTTTLAQAAYDNSPPMVKGAIENLVPQFKGPKQGDKQVYVRPSDVKGAQGSYARDTKGADGLAGKLGLTEETMRYAGLTSQKEATAKNNNFLVNQAKGRSQDARDAAMTELFDAVRRDNKTDIKRYALSYVNNHGDDASFASDFGRKVNDFALTPDQRRIINATSLAAIRDVQRQLRLQGK